MYFDKTVRFFLFLFFSFLNSPPLPLQFAWRRGHIVEDKGQLTFFLNKETHIFRSIFFYLFPIWSGQSSMQLNNYDMEKKNYEIPLPPDMSNERFGSV